MSVEVLYVGGTGRSGSTVVANALGADPSTVSVGELRFLWRRGVIEDRLCGCGAPFSACGFWQDVMQQAYAGSPPDAAWMHRQLTAVTQLRQLPRFATARTRRQLASSRAAAQVTPALLALYSAILQVSGARVVVDSSKLPTYAMLLDGIPGIDVRVAHLVRDPRAAAFSWRRKKEQPDRRRPGYMEQRGSLKSAVLWTVWNAALERGWADRPGAYARRRYEDLVAAPARELTALAALVGVDDLESLFLDEVTLMIKPSHTVAGNPARLSSGPTRLVLDDEWVSAMAARDQRIVTAVAGPLMTRYGYDRAVTPTGVVATS